MIEQYYSNEVRSEVYRYRNQVGEKINAQQRVGRRVGVRVLTDDVIWCVVHAR